MDLERVKSEALKLSLTDRLELAQALLKSFHPQSKPKVIDNERPANTEPDFRIEPDPVVTVDPVTEAPRRIAIPESALKVEPASSLPEVKLDGGGTASISEAFQKLHSALEAETESS